MNSSFMYLEALYRWRPVSNTFSSFDDNTLSVRMLWREDGEENKGLIYTSLIPTTRT
jgi:hypothetical protein